MDSKSEVTVVEYDVELYQTTMALGPDYAQARPTKREAERVAKDAAPHYGRVIVRRVDGIYGTRVVAQWVRGERVL